MFAIQYIADVAMQNLVWDAVVQEAIAMGLQVASMM